MIALRSESLFHHGSGITKQNKETFSEFFAKKEPRLFLGSFLLLVLEHLIKSLGGVSGGVFRFLQGVGGASHLE